MGCEGRGEVGEGGGGAGGGEREWRLGWEGVKGGKGRGEERRGD